MYGSPLEVRHVECIRSFQGKVGICPIPIRRHRAMLGPWEHWEIEVFFKIRATELLKAGIIAHDQPLVEGPPRAH